MFVKVFAVFGFFAVAFAADLSIGSGGKLIFEQNVTASPAIWRQVKTLTVNATNNTDEVICRVVVIDNRPDKDGEVNVIEGGEGHENVTLEMKSPAVFRGLDFSIQVYADEAAQVPYHPKSTGIDTQTPQLSKNLNVNENQEPNNGGEIPTASSTTEATKNDQQNFKNPALVGQEEQTRLNLDNEEQKTENQASVPTPVDVDTTKGIKVTTTKAPAEIDENLKKTLDAIFESNSTQTDEDIQKVLPTMAQAESEDFAILTDKEENRKVRQPSKEPVVPALPKELTKDDHTTPESELSFSTTEKNVGQEKNLKVAAVTSDSVSSTTSSDNLTIQSKLPENVKTTQELEANIKGHLGHHHAVPIPYQN